MRSVNSAGRLPGLARAEVVVNCHHNYATREQHLGRDLWITRKGAVRAGKGELGIIPGSMGAKSFIVRGKGNPASYCSCSHGAGRAMSRTEARKRFTLADHTAATEGVDCRKDDAVISGRRGPLGAPPPTPPCVRFRTRRFMQTSGNGASGR